MDTLTTPQTAQTSHVALSADEAKKQQKPMDFLFRAITISIPKIGDLLDGVVVAREGAALYVNLAPYGTGIIYGREYFQASDLIKNLNIGDTITAKVVMLENDDGYVELSLQEAGMEIVWKEADELQRTRQHITAPVLEANKGGLVLSWKGLTGFLPASQLNSKHYPRVEGGDKEKIQEELKKLIGTALTVTVLTIDQKEEKVIFSEKSIEDDALQVLAAKYHVGDVASGAVTGIVDFGIFVRLEEGLEGLAHISELDWSLVNNPADLFKEGDRVDVKIIGIDGGKISLSVKALKPDPWQLAAERYHKGDIVEGVVIRLNKYGALVSIEEGISGLCHVSEFKSEKEVRELLRLGKSYPFQILTFEPKDRQLTLSFLGKESGDTAQPEETAEVKEVVKKAEKPTPSTDGQTPVV